MFSKHLIAVALCSVLTAVASLGVDDAVVFEENDKFCIRSEPALLSEMEKRITPLDSDSVCETTVTLLTTKEKESFWSTMCKDLGGTHQEDYRYFRMRNGDLNGVASYHEICGGRANPLLAWMPYEMMQERYAQELNPKERLNCIAKATDVVGRGKTELCYFRQSDLAANITSDLFTCTVMIFEDHFFGQDANINVLIELEPVIYVVRNITYMPWTNVTSSYKTMLGTTVLKNPSREKKQIYSSIPYAFVEKVRLNVSSVYTANLAKLPLMFEHKNAILELDGSGVGGVDVKKKAYFGRTMDPQSSVNVNVIGQWAEHRRQFIADVYEYFGYGVKRFKQEMHNGDVAFVLIESTEPVFEQAESTNLALATLHSTKEDAQTKFERLSEQNSVNGTSDTDGEWDEYGEWEHPFPSLYPWFVVSSLIVGSLLLAAVIMVVRSCTKKEQKHQYKIAGV